MTEHDPFAEDPEECEECGDYLEPDGYCDSCEAELDEADEEEDNRLAEGDQKQEDTRYGRS